MNSRDSVGYTDIPLARLQQGDLIGFHVALVNGRDDSTGRKVNNLLATTSKFSKLDSHSKSIIQELDSINCDELVGLAEVISQLQGAMTCNDSEG
jgi:hypothetical protein